MLLKGRNVLYSLSKHDSYGNTGADCFPLVDGFLGKIRFFPFIRVPYCNVKNNMSVILILYNRVTNILDTIFPFALPIFCSTNENRSKTLPFWASKQHISSGSNDLFEQICWNYWNIHSWRQTLVSFLNELACFEWVEWTIQWFTHKDNLKSHTAL